MLSSIPGLPKKWTTSKRNHWTTSTGIGGQHRMERVDNFKWNGRSTSTGIRILCIAPVLPVTTAVVQIAACVCGPAIWTRAQSPLLLPGRSAGSSPAPALRSVLAVFCNDISLSISRGILCRRPHAHFAGIQPCHHSITTLLKAYRLKGGGLKPGGRS